MSVDGNIILNLYKRNGIFCCAPQETVAGGEVLKNIVVGETLEDLLLKLHAKYGLAIEDVDTDCLFVEEVF